MKGQFLPVETVLSLGLGLILALGSVTAFNTLRQGILDSAQDNQVQVIQSKISDTIYTISTMNKKSRSQIQVNLPKKIAGKSYTVALNKGSLKINVRNKLYETDYNQLKNNYSLRGTADGGKIKITKTQNKIIIAPR